MAEAMNDGCRVHDSVTQCISRQMDRLRIATALVVIRDKPVGQSAREFATSLQIFHRDRVSHLTVKNDDTVSFSSLWHQIWQERSLHDILVEGNFFVIIYCVVSFVTGQEMESRLRASQTRSVAAASATTFAD